MSDGGSADTTRARERGWSWTGQTSGVEAQEGERPSAMFTAYAPPHRLALTSDDADRIIDRHGTALRTATRGNNRAPYLQIEWADLAPDLRDRLLAALHAANDCWWRVDLNVVTAGLLRYPVGARHSEHQDMHPGAMQRKLALSVQLSGPGHYEGGDLTLRAWGEEVAMPREKGTVVAFPGWTAHSVTPVEHGERWALILWAWGPPLR